MSALQLKQRITTAVASVESYICSGMFGQNYTIRTDICRVTKGLTHRIFVTSSYKLKSVHYKTNVSILAKSLIISFQYDIESVCFFYSNPVLWDHRCICGPSLTETSLYCAWLCSRSVLHKVTPGPIFHPVLGVFPIIPPILRTHLLLNNVLIRRTSGHGMITLKQSNAASDTKKHWPERCFRTVIFRL
jgi:hypothetical protein